MCRYFTRLVHVQLLVLVDVTKIVLDINLQVDWKNNISQYSVRVLKKAGGDVYRAWTQHSCAYLRFLFYIFNCSSLQRLGSFNYIFIIPSNSPFCREKQSYHQKYACKKPLSKIKTSDPRLISNCPSEAGFFCGYCTCYSQHSFLT